MRAEAAGDPGLGQQQALAGRGPFARVAADSVYGVDEVENTLRRAGRGYVSGENSSHWFGFWNTVPLMAGETKDIAQELPAGLGNTCWRVSAPRASDCTAGPVARWPTFTSRRRIRYPHAGPVDTRRTDPAQYRRWRNEEAFETAQNEFGLDHNDTRFWHRWYRHGRPGHDGRRPLSANTVTKNRAQSGRDLIRWSIQDDRHLALKLPQQQSPGKRNLKWSMFRRTHLKSRMQF